jgi:Arc/MetJ family transcription regulator
MSEESQERRVIDWEAVERAYRAGVLSLREIGKIHDVSEGMIRKKAKAGGWERDLSGKVAEKVRNDLVRNPVRTANPQTEREIVEEAAATVVQVVRSHRSAITKGKDIVDTLMHQLLGAAGRREELEEIIEEETASDMSTQRRSMLMKAVSLSTHSTVAVNLANAAKTWIGLERQSFNLADGASWEDPTAPAESSNLTAEEAYRKMIEGR